MAAGYAIYGPSTMMVLTLGNGTHGFTLDRGFGEFVMSHPALTVPAETRELAVNDDVHHSLAAGASLLGVGSTCIEAELAQQLGVADIVEPMQMTTLEAAAAWPHGACIGVLHIDASHEYEDVRADFEAWERYVAPGGFIVFDDVPSWPGPTRFVQELPPSYEFFTASPNQHWVRKRV